MQKMYVPSCGIMGKCVFIMYQGFFLVILGWGPRAFQIDKISAANPLIGKFVIVQ